MAIIAAPTIISSIDETVDISNFYGIGEEEESENFKLLFDNTFETSEYSFVIQRGINLLDYVYKTYPKPHLNLIFPPPESKVI